MFIFEWLLSIVAWIVIVAIILMLMDRLEFGIKVGSFGAAVMAAFSIGVLFWLIRLVRFGLSLWDMTLQGGLLSILIGWLVAAAAIYFVSKLGRGFEIRNFGTALIGALVMGLMMAGVEAILGLFFG